MNEINTILKKRAALMAIEPEQKSDGSKILNIIGFSLAHENYGVESAFVRGAFTLNDFTPLPGVPSFILGIVNFRGLILPVLDLKVLFNIQGKGLGELNKVIILSDGQLEFGILADEVTGTKEINYEDILPSPYTLTKIGGNYLKGITKDGLIILSAGNLLTDKNLIVNEEVK